MFRLKFIIIFIILSTVLQSQPIDSKHSSRLDNEWSIVLPIWIPGFRGDFAYGEVNLEGEDGGNPSYPTPEHPIEPGEGLGGNIFSRFFGKDTFLKFFYMSKFSYAPNRFLFQLDGFGGSAGTAIKFNYNNKEIVSTSYNIFIGHFYVGYSVFQKLDYSKEQKTNIYLYTGLRYINSTIKANLERNEFEFEVNPKKSEMLLGINAVFIFTNWEFNINGDVGGFTSKSNVFSYKIQLLAYYYLGKSTSIRFGWTDMDLKHDNLFKNERLLIHTHLSGPNLGIAFDF